MTAIDPWELSEFTDRFRADLATAAHAVTVVIGERLGLYRALAETGPATPAMVAAAAGCDERYVIEWLNTQAAAGYCEYDDETGRFSLSEAQEACLADPDGPAFLAAAMRIPRALFADCDALTDVVRSGAGLPRADHHPDLLDGLHHLHRPAYTSSLINSWLPALEGVTPRLHHGIPVADVGCAHGTAAILLAKAYPRCTITGFDPHRASVETARKAAVDAGVGDRVTFEVAAPHDFPGHGYGLICTLDTLHHLGDPVAAASHIRSALAPGGTWLLAEPMAGETVADNLTDISRLHYALSTLVCTPNARAQPGGWALGAQPSETQLGNLTRRAGFTHFRRATETPLHRIFDIRP